MVLGDDVFEKPRSRHTVVFRLTEKEYRLAKQLADITDIGRGGVSAIARASLLHQIRKAIEEGLIKDDGLI